MSDASAQVLAYRNYQYLRGSDSRDDILMTTLVMEGPDYAYRDNGLIFSLNAQMWSIELLLLKFGTPTQQRAYLPGLVSAE